LAISIYGDFGGQIPGHETRLEATSGKQTHEALDHQEAGSLFGRPYRIVDYLLLADLVWEKNTIQKQAACSGGRIIS